MTRIIISEKPSMGRAIAAALGIQGTGRNFIQGADVIVTWCVGHLVQAMGPEGYDPGLKSWRLDTVPFFPEPFLLLTHRGHQGSIRGGGKTHDP